MNFVTQKLLAPAFATTYLTQKTFAFFVVEFERKLLMALEELKSNVAQNTRILQMLQASNIAAVDVSDLPGDVQLPVSTI